MLVKEDIKILVIGYLEINYQRKYSILKCDGIRFQPGILLLNKKE